MAQRRRVFISSANPDQSAQPTPGDLYKPPGVQTTVPPFTAVPPTSSNNNWQPPPANAVDTFATPLSNNTNPPQVNPIPNQIGTPVAAPAAPPTSPQTSSFQPPSSSGYIRMTMNCVPQTPQLLQKVAIPLGCVIHPMNTSEALPVIDFGSVGVVRCKRCRSYVNPYVQFLDAGRRWKCNLCGLPNDVPNHYFSQLDDSGVRRDINDRPELIYNTVEFVASAEYMSRPPQPPVYFFVMDVSYNAVSSGQLASACGNILRTLSSLPEDSNTKVGFITYDSKCHLYHLRSTSSKPFILSMNPVDKIPIPSGYDFLVNLRDCIAVITTLLTELPKMYANTKEVRSCLGPAIRTAFLMQKPIGGKMIVFSATLPSVGIGKIDSRFDRKLLGTDKEISLLKPANEWYKKLALRCSKHQVSVDLFLFSRETQPPLDLPSLGQLCEISSGQLFFYPSYGNHILDSYKFEIDLWNNLTRETGFESVMRVRCSTGVTATHHHGNLFVRSTDLLALPNIDPSKAFGIQLSVSEDLNSIISTIGPNVAVQAALLYTTSNSERRIRVMTISVPIVNNIASIYPTLDAEAIVNLTAKMAISKALSNKLSDAKDALFNKLVDIISTYRQNNPSSSFSQFPPSLELLPLYFLGCIKSVLFRGGTVSPDVRSAAFQLFKILPVEESCMFLCPRFMALHNMQEECGLADEAGNIILPPLLNLSSEKLDRNGIFLLNNGQCLILRISKQVDPNILYQLFGTTDINQIIFQQVVIQNIPEQPENSLMNRIANIINYLQSDKLYFPRLYVIKEGDPLDSTFMTYLVEDRNIAESYQEFLIRLQRALTK